MSAPASAPDHRARAPAGLTCEPARPLPEEVVRLLAEGKDVAPGELASNLTNLASQNPHLRDGDESARAHLRQP
eukprot:tig00020780_g13812.t1